ncbi:MAG: cytochrome C biogenesis protein [Candidatus Eisenbacteria sp.]|nr:cytochrome C biogenesis protein [Candidatus Eisenbacteria bacterium]
MIENLFSALSGALEGSPPLALSASAVWGILSILLSPCHLASIPLIVGFIGQQGEITTRRAFWLALLFSTGILVTIAVIGVITASMGRLLGDIGAAGNYIVAVIFFLVGLHLVGVIPMPWSGPARTRTIGRGSIAAFLLGLIFGIAIGPCTFAFMAPMLGITFRVAGTNPGYGVALLAAYGVGHCSVIVAAGTFTEVVQHYLNWTEASRGSEILRKVCGVLVILGGAYLIWSAS